MHQLWARIMSFVFLVTGLGIGFLMIRGSIDAETGNDIADAMSVLPFSDSILHWLRSFMPLDSTVFDIQQGRPFIMQLLILLVESAILSPILLGINNAFGPILFRTSANEYQTIGDYHGQRTRDRMVRRLVKLLLIVNIVPFVAFLSGYLLDVLFELVNGLFVVWRVLCYAAMFAAVITIACIPVLHAGSRKKYLVFVISVFQRILYTFITNVIILAVVALLIAGVSGWDFIWGLIVMVAWMTFYSDTDGFLSRRTTRTTA